ncbi:hypothetical protein I4F81_012053 [Pyropia yezoensis]|uniref:Uncharacterized protein n=1 Tax=Pyropia yezoensis TaxID=2788 RepID=A0ACC3CHC6_PYRYE|nr:hypothetical protein I4F81_012053 [Neopyropia yezoensis]
MCEAESRREVGGRREDDGRAGPAGEGERREAAGVIYRRRAPGQGAAADRVPASGERTKRGVPQPVSALGRAARPRLPASALTTARVSVAATVRSWVQFAPSVARRRPGGSNWSYAETKASNNAEAADLLASAQAIGATAQNRVHMPQSMNHTSHWKPLLLAVQRDQTTHAWSGTTILNPHQVTNRQKDGTPKTRAKAHPLTRLYLPGACEKEELFEGTWHAAQRHAHAGVRASCTDGAPSHVDGHAHKPEQQEAKPGPRRPTRAHVKRPA